MLLKNTPTRGFLSPFIICTMFSAYSPLYAEETKNSSITLANITVMASKRNEELFKIPYAVDVVDENLLKAININQLGAITSLNSNFSIQQNGVYKNAIIRGVGGGGRNAGFDARTVVYIDGVNVGQTFALESLLFDLDHIEIIKGPQGHTFGNQSDSGAINIQSNQATNLPFARFKLGSGNLEYKESEAILNLPLNQNVLSRISVRSESRDGYVRNEFDQSMLKGFSNLAVKANLLINTSENHTLKLFADYAEQHNQSFLAQSLTGMFGQPNQNNNAFDKTALNTKPKAEIETEGISLQSERFFADESKLDLIFAARKNNLRRKTDNDYSANDVLMTDYEDQNHFSSQEFRFSSSDISRTRYVLGLYFSQDSITNNRTAILGNDMNTLIKLPNVPIFLPFGTAFGVIAGSKIPIDATVKTHVQAIYANGSHDIDQFTFHIGGRYQVEQKHLDYNMDGSRSGAFNIGTLNSYKQDISNQFFSPMAALSFHLNESNELFGKYSRAFKSGGWNVDFLNRAQIRDGFEFKPESVNSVELGWRQKGTHHFIQAGIFQNEYHDYQVFQFANLGGAAQTLQLRNAAEVRTRGVEIAGDFKVQDSLNIRSNIGFLDARYVSFPGGATNGNDASGNLLPDAPRWSVSNAVVYHSNLSALKGEVEASLQHFYQADTYSGISNESELSHLPSRSLFNSTVTYTPNAYKNGQIYFWIRNITNQQFAVAKGKDILGNQIAIFNEPRVWGVGLSFQF